MRTLLWIIEEYLCVFVLYKISVNFSSGCSPLTKESYEWPYHCFNKENSTSAFSMCCFQPKQTIAEVNKTPWMYKTESQIYGSGKPVSNYIDTLSGPIRDYANNTIGNECCTW